MAGLKQSNRRAFVAKTAILGLVFQAVMAAVMLPMPLGTRSAQAGASPDIILICTPTGLKQISFDASGNPVEKDMPGSGCPVCDALATATFALPAIDGGAPLPAGAADIAPSPSDCFIASIAHRTHNNRGPPARA